MEFDLVVVGGGPSGLATAIRFAQMASAAGEEFTVCLVEKGSEIGAHILSGAIFEPTALDELFPDWQEMGAPLKNPVTIDEVHYLTDERQGLRVPSLFVPKATHNEGNHAISLGNLCRWLGEQAEELGVNVFPGFAATEVLFNEDGSVRGIATGDMGIGADGEQKATYAPGYELLAKYTVFAEGCRGHLGKQLMARYNLQQNSGTQHYAIGLKELWKVDPEKHIPGKVVHSVGWPLGHFPGETIGGSFMYHLEKNEVVVGLIVDLSYSNPHVSPFDEFQRFKHHPLFRSTLEGGEHISYGARAIVKGGLQALPKLVMPGALLVGDDAGFLNYLKIKGSHTAMKSGMMAGETVYEAVKRGSGGAEELTDYPEKFRESWLYDELHAGRNVGPAMHKLGMFLGSAYAFADQMFGGRLPFTFKDNKADHDGLKLAARAEPIDYPKPDGEISFDKLSSVFLTNTFHEEDQPCHLQLTDDSIPIFSNLVKFDEPAQRYCPAGVYEVVEQEDGEKQFQINAQNCIHCKTCDIKDPAQNITWVAPEGTGGPNYPNM